MRRNLMIRYLIILLTGIGIQFSWAQPISYSIAAFESSNLPIVVIDTDNKQIPDSPKIPATMGIIWNGDGQRSFIADTFNDYDGDIMIELRGATSQGFPKKQYALETVDAQGENNNVSLLGLPEENDWILHAPYSDKSLMRNVLEYRLARDLGWYASRTKYCELFLNGEYRGVYILMEKIKRDKNRVDIAKLKPEDISGDELTGGYIVKIDKIKGDETEGWHSDNPKNPALSDKIFYQYHYPKYSDITAEQKTYIRNYLNEFESAMESDAYSDSLNGYEKYIDVPSFIDFLILNEIGKNVDAYSLSTFMNKDKESKGGKLKMGPVWDFNLAFGNVNYNDSELIEGWRLYMPYKDIPFWWKKFVNDERFVSKLSERWSSLRENQLSDKRVLSVIDSVANLLDEAQERNFEKWDILGQYIWPNNYIGNTYSNEVGYLKRWIIDRLAWMDDNIVFDYDSEIIEDQGEYALLFDGDGDYVDCGDDNALAITGKEITLEAWVKVHKFKDRSYKGAIISRDKMASGSNFGYVLRCGGNGYVDFIFGDGNWTEIQSPANAISRNVWTHLAATYDGSKMKLYINGNKVAEKTEGSSIKASPSTHFFIGNSPADMSRSFNGIIDEVRIWNKTRTENQIVSTMNIRLNEIWYSSPDSGLAGYWRFNEGKGNRTKDKTQNDNSGFLGELFNGDKNEPAWGPSDMPVGIEYREESVIREFKLDQNFPNPFNPSTTISFYIPEISKVQLNVYNVLGQKIAELVNRRMNTGSHKVVWNAGNLSSGIYYYTFQAGNISEKKKMILIK